MNTKSRLYLSVAAIALAGLLAVAPAQLRAQQSTPPGVSFGATDLGGLSANGDHISPEHPFPSPHQVRKELQRDGYALTERLCVYPRYIDPEFLSRGVMDTIKARYWSFIPRRGSGRTEPPTPIRPSLAALAIDKGRDGLALSADELTALFAETRPEAISTATGGAALSRREVKKLIRRTSPCSLRARS